MTNGAQATNDPHLRCKIVRIQTIRKPIDVVAMGSMLRARRCSVSLRHSIGSIRAAYWPRQQTVAGWLPGCRPINSTGLLQLAYRGDFYGRCMRVTPDAEAKHDRARLWWTDDTPSKATESQPGLV